MLTFKSTNVHVSRFIYMVITDITVIGLSTGLTPHVHRKKGGGDIYFFTYANVFVTTLTFI